MCFLKDILQRNYSKLVIRMLNVVFYNDDDETFKACTSSAMETEVNLLEIQQIGILYLLGKCLVQLTTCISKNSECRI